jgi:hypothetical protein
MLALRLKSPSSAGSSKAPKWSLSVLTPRRRTSRPGGASCVSRGVDYFSTLAYQPSIAFVAAGLLSPLATLVLILLTLFGALPMYYRVAEASPHGQGSILMLESLFPRWKGKAVVLILLGFAATSFVITITLSAADATAHLIENPLMPAWMQHPVLVTLGLLLVLGAVFMRGFSEVIGMAVAIVGIHRRATTAVLEASTGLKPCATAGPSGCKALHRYADFCTMACRSRKPASTSFKCTRSTRRPRDASTSRSPRACNRLIVPKL